MRNMKLRSAVDSLKAQGTDAIRTLASAIDDIHKHLDQTSTDLQTVLDRVKHVEDKLESLERNLRDAKS